MSYYPADLPIELANILDGAHTLDLRRLGRQGKLVGRIHLKHEGSTVAHGKRSDKTDEQLAAEIWAQLEADAEHKCRGHAKYRVIATYAKPPRGTTADPASFDLEVGEPPTLSEADHRVDLITELRRDRVEMHRQYIELGKQNVEMAKAVGGMATGLASAWSTVHEKQAEAANGSLERMIIQQEHDGERERMRMLERTLLPMMGMFRAKTTPAALPPASDASANAEPLRPEIVRIARAFGASLTPAQLDSAARKLGGNRLAELVTVEHEHEALSILAWLIEHDTSIVMSVYGELRDEQVPMVERLQVLAVEAGQRRAAG